MCDKSVLFCYTRTPLLRTYVHRPGTSWYTWWIVSLRSSAPLRSFIFLTSSQSGESLFERYSKSKVTSAEFPTVHPFESIRICVIPSLSMTMDGNGKHLALVPPPVVPGDASHKAAAAVVTQQGERCLHLWPLQLQSHSFRFIVTVPSYYVCTYVPYIVLPGIPSLWSCCSVYRKRWVHIVHLTSGLCMCNVRTSSGITSFLNSSPLLSSLWKSLCG